MIHFESLNKKELQDFVESGRYASYAFLPITKHRALSQITNPKASEEDILLTLAFYNGELAGYLGTLPDELDNDEKKLKFAWLSTLYVNENFRGKRIAQKILEFIFEKFEGKVAMTEFTKEAETLYIKTKACSYIPPKKGVRYYLKSDLSTILPKRKKSLATYKNFLGIADCIINTGSETKKMFLKNKKLKASVLQELDAESEVFISKFPKNRSAEELNLIMQNPWVLEGKSIEKEYLFSSFSNEFKYFWVKIFNKNNQLETCAMLLLRDGHLKIPYLFFDNDLRNFKSFLTKFCKEKNVKVMTSYQSEVNHELSSGFGKIYKKNIERRYLFHHHLLEKLPKNYQNTFQDGDGDCVFT